MTLRASCTVHSMKMSFNAQHNATMLSLLIDATQNGLTENAGHENDGHEIDRGEIGGQDNISFENKLHYNAVCNSF